MTKQTKMILGVGVVAVAGYLLWKQSKMKGFANAAGTSPSAMRCCGHTGKTANAESPSGFTYDCCNGQKAPYSNANPCSSCPSTKKATTEIF
jgi:hypothetical protein